MVKAVKVITKGTKTSTGGVVLDGHENCTFGGQPATSVGQRASCGRCGKIGLIAANGNHETYLPDGKQAATPHCRVLCDCANNYLLEPSHNVYIGDSRGAGTGQVFLGGNVHFGDNVFINTGSTSASPLAQASQISQGDPIVPPKPKLRNVVDSAEVVVNAFSQSIEDIVSKSIKDGVYVWIETKGVGHTLISIFKNGKTTIYTYGRYSINDDDGVLIIYKNQDALNYINRELFKMNASVYLIPDADEDSINEYFCSLWKNGIMVNDPRGADDESKARIKKYGRSIDRYELMSSNCTTHSLDAVRVKGSEMFPSNLEFTIPNSLDEYLQNKFSKHDRTVNFEIFYSNIYDENSKEYEEGLIDSVYSTSIEGVSFISNLFEL
ncbi:TPA: PAAR domain-containing protein [Vibrio parahaemolyticus]|nr:PAAR domain-containing protein [Vibrio parahaemolyticus]